MANATYDIQASQFNIDRSHPARWTVTFSNPPINMFIPTTIVELGALMTDLEADPSVKVVVFQSANPDFFIAHLDVAKAVERPDLLGFWRDFVLRLSSTPVVSIAKIRGRTRGIGNEFVLACDMRFASRQNAVFGNPEVGVGLIPGGGALEWLPRLVGRSRALEIVLSGDDFDADIAERYGWVNRTLDDKDLDLFVDSLASRLASFGGKTLATAKAQINRFGMPTAAELQSSNEMIFPMLAWPDAQARRTKLRGIGYGIRSDFELNFGRYLPSFGPRDDHDTDMRSVASKGNAIHAPIEDLEIGHENGTHQPGFETISAQRTSDHSMKRTYFPAIIDIVDVTDPSEIRTISNDSRFDRDFIGHGPVRNVLRLRKLLRIFSLNGRVFQPFLPRTDSSRAAAQDELWSRLNVKAAEVKHGPAELEPLAEWVRGIGNAEKLDLLVQQSIGRLFVKTFTATEESVAAARLVLEAASSSNVLRMLGWHIRGRLERAKALLASMVNGDLVAVIAMITARQLIVDGLHKMRQLAADPALRSSITTDAAVDECLFTVTNVVRQAKTSGEVGGCPFRRGTLFILELGSASRGAANRDLVFLSQSWSRCPAEKWVPALLEGVWTRVSATLHESYVA